MSAIAQKLNVKTDADLALAAAASLQLCQARETFDRKELAEEAAKAPAFFGKNFKSNLSKTLSSLLKADKLREPSPQTYTLRHSEYQRLQEALA